MGFLDRIGKVAQGFGSVITAPIELTVDLAQGAFTDKDFDLWGSFLKEGGEALSGVFGADTGLGAAAGALPKGVRRGVATPVGKVFEGFETAGREGIREPLSTLMTYASLYDAPGGGGTLEFLTEIPGLNDRATETWREARRIAQHRSIGEAITLASTTKDIRDPVEVKRAENSAWFHAASGVSDAILRLSNLDPMNAAGKAASAGRLRYLHTPIRDIDEAMNSTKVARFVEAIDGKNATEIRDQFFPRHAEGGFVSTLLADAADPTAKRQVLRSLMGDGKALVDLQARRGDLAHKITNLVVQQADQWEAGSLFHEPGRMAQLQSELEQLYPEADYLTRAVETHGVLSEVPRYSRVSATRSAVGRSQLYQESALTKPLKAFTNRLPQHWVDINDSRADIQFSRQLRRSGTLAREEQDAWRARLMESVSPGQRQQTLIEAEDEMVKRILRDHGVSQADLDRVMAEARRNRDTAMGTLRNRSYDAEGRGSLMFEDSDGQMVQIAMPIHITQQADLLPLADMDAVKRAAQIATGRGAGRWRQAMLEHPMTDLPEDALELFYKVWRPSVLLRFGWPQRILMDEQMRIASEIGVLATLAEMPRGLAQLGDRAVSAAGRRAAPVVERFAQDAVEARAINRLDEAVTAGGMEFPSAFGAAGDPANVMAGRASARGSMRELVGGERSRILGEMRQHTGEFRTISPLEAENYPGAFEWAVNKHIRQSAMARQFLEGKNVDEVVAWLTGKVEQVEPPVASGMTRLYRGVNGRTRPLHLDDEQVEQVGRWFTPERSAAEFYGDPEIPLRYVDVPEATAREWATNDWSRPLKPGDNIIRDAPEALIPRQVADAAQDLTLAADITSGPEYARAMGWRPHTFHAHAEDVEDQISRYLPGDLRTMAAQGDVTHDDLVRLIDKGARPAVHGEDLQQALGTSTLGRLVSSTVEKAFHGLGVLPTDALSRQPYFAHLYEQEVTRLGELTAREAAKAGRELDAADVQRIAGQARRYALNQTQELLFDLAEKSEMAHVLRFMAPFFPAWQEMLTVWGGQAVKRPAFMARMHQAWVSPERAGLVTDENGNVVDADGGATSPITGDKVAAGSERIVTLPFSIPGLPTTGKVSFNKKSLNLVLTGSPGVGPVVQVPVNEIIKTRPDLADSLKFVLPFGSTQEVTSLLFPATVRRFKQRTDGEEDRVYRNTMIRMFYDRMVDYRMGKRDEKPTYAEVKRDTNALFNLRTVASFVLPVAPIFESPYKPWIDTYRQAQQRVRDDPAAVSGQSLALADESGAPRSADEWFYDTFGEEFFPLAQSLSSSKDGIAPTIAGWQAREKYKDLVEEYPELGGLIVGKEGAGEFARGVYDQQLSTPVRPGSGTKQRETPSFEEAAVKPDIAEGWLKFGRYMDLIDAARISQGLPNLQVKAASQLAGLKRALIEKTAEEHPDWFTEFSKVDRQAFNRRIKGMRAVVSDQRLDNRRDLDGLRDYLDARDLVLGVLAARDATSLTAARNRDIALLWETIKGKLVEQNLAFGDLFHRYLENDPMILDASTKAA